MHRAGTQIDSQTLYERQKESLQLKLCDQAPVIIATGLRTPDNIASVLRLADAANSTRVIFVTQEKDRLEFNHKIQRLSRSTEKNIKIEQYDVEEFNNLIDLLPVMIAIEITTRSKSIFESLLPDECCLVIGSESNGVYDQILEKCNSAVHIPMYGKNGSMNVSHALAISLFEWRRQRL